MNEDSKTSLRISEIEQALGGKYKIISRIGVGGFGEVYLGEHTQLRRKVAIKILSANLAGQQDVVKRFEREARAAATLSHPNIIDIYDVGDSGEVYYFVMKYIDGESLSEKMQREKKFPPGEAINIVKQVADALDYAHAHDIVHRDIKPANVMLDEYGKPVLMDFGVARVQFESNLTKTGTLMGTPHYLPPELPLGKRVDGRSDIYSLGIMLYEMLSGRPPFHDENSVALIFKHINEPPGPLNEVAPELDPALCIVVHKMIEKSPDNRYQTAGEVVDALQELSFIYPPLPVASRRSTTPGASKNTEKLLLLAQEHVQQQKFSKAIELYATIARRDPNNETAKREVADLVTRLVEKIREHLSNHEIAQARELLRQANQLSFKDIRLSEARLELEQEERKLEQQKEEETSYGINFDAAATALEKNAPEAAIDALSRPPEQKISEPLEDLEGETKTIQKPTVLPKSEATIAQRVESASAPKAEEKKETVTKPAVPAPAPAAVPASVAAIASKTGASSGIKWKIPAIIVLVLAVGAGAWFSMQSHAPVAEQSTDPSLLHKLAETKLKPESTTATPEKPTAGELSITSTPDGAKVFLGEEEKGVTPLKLANLPFGKYSVKLQMKGYKDLLQDVEFNESNAGQPIPLVLEAAAPQVGTLLIESKPPGAVIVVNNRAIGVTPKTMSNTNVGKYNVLLKLEGYQDYTGTARVKEGQTATLTAELVEIPKPVVVVEKPKEPEIKPGMIVNLGPDVVPPKAIKKASAKYPDTKDKKLEGTVRLIALVSETGKVLDIKIVQSAHPLLDKAATDAVKQWVFEPAKKQGIVVKVWLPVSMSFQRR
jgi:TonB family protein